MKDSKNSDKIAKADIYYSENNTENNDEDDTNNKEDKEILKAIPLSNDRTKFKLPDDIDITKIKIKAVLTYDNNGNLLDYDSSYSGIGVENDNITIDFENSKDNKAGFGGGDGSTLDTPYIISKPRHFANINAKDKNGNYLYLDNQKHFEQTENLDFTHLTGLKIINDPPNDQHEDKTYIKIETVNKKAPFYNEGHGIAPIGELNITQDIEDLNNIEEPENLATLMSKAFQGDYQGKDYIIDGIIVCNRSIYGGLFAGIYNGTAQGIHVGKNSIFFFNELPTISGKTTNNLYVGSIAGFRANSKIENCKNNATFLLRDINIESDIVSTLYIAGIVGSNYKKSSNETLIQSNENFGNLTIQDCNFKICNIWMAPICNIGPSQIGERNKNEGNINIIKNSASTTLNIYILPRENTMYENKGNIKILSNNNNDDATDKKGIIMATNITNYYPVPKAISNQQQISECRNDHGHIFINDNENFIIKLAKNIYSHPLDSTVTPTDENTNGYDNNNDGGDIEIYHNPNSQPIIDLN